jgi:hypothetical protein
MTERLRGYGRPGTLASSGQARPALQSIASAVTALIGQVALRENQLRTRASARPGAITKPIEHVNVGDTIWAWDETAAIPVERSVRRLFRHHAQPTVTIALTTGHRSDELIEATPEHPFWVEGRGWVAARSLQRNDLLKCIHQSACLRVSSVTSADRRASVFNFEVEGAHNYFIGRSGMLVHNASAGPQSDPATFNGVYVEGLPLALDESTSPEVRRFVAGTLQVSNYVSMQQLKTRARNFLRFNPAELAIEAATRRALSDPSSAVSLQDRHALELVRTFWAEADLSPELRKVLADQVRRRDLGIGILGKNLFDRLYVGAGELHARMILGEALPSGDGMTNMGIEALNSLKNFADVLGKPRKELTEIGEPPSEAFAALLSHVESVRVQAERAGTHHFKTPTGTDLSSDLGTLVRDELGVPVMYGTSGGTSDITSTLQFIARRQSRSAWADGLGDRLGLQTHIDLIHHFMRGSPVPWAQDGPYQRAWAARDARPDAFNDPFNSFSHTYSEVSQAARMTLRGQRGTDIVATHAIVERDLLRLIDLSW